MSLEASFCCKSSKQTACLLRVAKDPHREVAKHVQARCPPEEILDVLLQLVPQTRLELALMAMSDRQQQLQLLQNQSIDAQPGTRFADVGQLARSVIIEVQSIWKSPS